ncbi:MAG: hypothetical protein SFV52_16655 [Saprospiraceae bacterium]|nr:hypothetical protein [Saprospiraceae bacterium]
MNLIEQYLLGQLNEQEAGAVEERLRTDDAFRAEYEAYLQAVDLVRWSGRQALKKRLKSRGQGMALRRKGLLMTGLVLGAALLCFYLWPDGIHIRLPPQLPVEPVLHDTFPQASDTLPLQVQEKSAPALPGKQPRRRDLFAEYYRPFSDDALDGTVRGTDPEPYSYEGFLMLYASGDFRAAALRFDSLPAVTRGNNTVQFLYAQALLHEGQATKALTYFDALRGKSRFRYAQEAEWYGALCLLKTGDRAGAKTRLGAIASVDEHPYRQEASLLMQALR